jgi:hypothetical protein
LGVRTKVKDSLNREVRRGKILTCIRSV